MMSACGGPMAGASDSAMSPPTRSSSSAAAPGGRSELVTASAGRPAHGLSKKLEPLDKSWQAGCSITRSPGAFACSCRREAFRRASFARLKPSRYIDKKSRARQNFVAVRYLRRVTLVDFVFRSRLSPAYHRELEELVFFNPRQRDAEAAITEAVDLYGPPAIVGDETGLRVVVGKRDDVQCLFALAPVSHPTAGELELAGIVMYLRISSEEIVVLHIGVAEAYCRSRRSGLEVVSALVRTVRAAARRLRGVERLTMLYLQGRQFRIAIGAGAQRPAAVM